MKYNTELDRLEGYTARKFFLAKFEGDPKEEEYYQLTRSFLTQTGRTHTANRVYSITYESRNGGTKTVAVGDAYNGSFVAAIFESDYLKGVFYVVTPGRGLPNEANIINPPYLITATEVLYFRDSSSPDSIK